MAASEATGRGDTASAAECSHSGYDRADPELGCCSSDSEETIIGQGFRLRGNFLGKSVRKDIAEI